MKTIPPLLDAHLKGETSTLAICMRIQRKDGAILGFTDHDEPIDLDAVTYESVPGLMPMQYTSNASLSVDNIEYEALIDSNLLKRDHLMWGVYDNASISIFLVNWAAPADGRLLLAEGKLGEITLEDSRFRTEMRSLSQYLRAQIGRIVSPECDVPVFAEGRCGLDKAAWTDSSQILTIVKQYKTFTVDTNRDDDFFKGGVLTFTSGENAGRSYSIKSQKANGELKLDIRTADTVVVGNNITLVAGCDRRSTTCDQKFNNLVNFQGFPFVPGRDSMLETPNAK